MNTGKKKKKQNKKINASRNSWKKLQIRNKRAARKKRKRKKKKKLRKAKKNNLMVLNYLTKQYCHLVIEGEIYYTEIPKRKIVHGFTGSDLTKLNFDKSTIL